MTQHLPIMTTSMDRRRFLGLSAMFGATALLAACAPEAGGGGAGGTKTLSLWNSAFDTVATTGSTTKAEADFWLTQALARFEKQTGTTVDLGDLPRDDKMFTQLRTAGAARKAPDVATIWSGAFIFGLKDFLSPLDDHYPADKRTTMVGWDAVTEGFVEGEGTIWGVPCGVDGLSALYFNNDVLDAAGVSFEPDVAQDWGAFTDTLGRLQATGATPLAMGSYEYMAFTLFYWMAQVTGGSGGIFALGEGTTEFSDPKVVAVVERWLSLVPFTAPGAPVNSGGDAIGKVVSGEAAGTVSGSWAIPDLRAGLDQRVTMTRIPDVEGATSSLGGGIGGPGLGFVVSATADVDAAVAFIDFLNTPEEQIARGKLTEPPMPNVVGLDAAEVYDDGLWRQQAEWSNGDFVFWADNTWNTELVGELFAQGQLAWNGDISAAEFMQRADAKRAEING